MELSAHAADGSGSDCSCPICLESMTRSESIIYPLPCLNCDFNFCSNCVESFCRASEDDFQMASDGSRQVKIHVACPQCRSKYPLEDLEDTVLLLRSAHELAEAIMIRQYDDEEEEPSGGGREETKENDPGSNNAAKKPQYRLSSRCFLSFAFAFVWRTHGPNSGGWLHEQVDGNERVFPL